MCTTETVQDTELKYPLTRGMQHDYFDGCDSADCGGTCHYCCLSICKVCGGAEGSLTSDCPGVKLTGRFDDMIYGSIVDFRNGHWLYGFSNRGMYKNPFDYIETEKMYLQIIDAQPSLDMMAIKESKYYKANGEDWLQKCYDNQTERDLKYIEMLSHGLTYSKVISAFKHLDYQNSLSDATMSTLISDMHSVIHNLPSREATMIAMQAGSNIKHHVLSKNKNSKLEFVTNKLYPELGEHLVLEKHEWLIILATLTVDRMVNNASYILLQNTIVDILRPTWER